MSNKNWQSGLEELLRSEQRNSFYAALRRSAPGLAGLQDMLKFPRPTSLGKSRGAHEADVRGSERTSPNLTAAASRPAPGPSAPSEPAPSQASATSNFVGTDAPSPLSPESPQAPDPGVGLAARWCTLSGLSEVGEWTQKYSDDPQVAEAVCRMHLLVACMRLDEYSTKAIVLNSSEFSTEQAKAMCHDASRLFYELAYKVQGRVGAEQVSRDSIYSQAMCFRDWILAELRQSPYSWLAERLVVHREGPYRGSVHDVVGEHQGHVKPVTFEIQPGPPDNRGVRPRMIAADKGGPEAW